MKHKYNAKKVIAGDLIFDSKAEHQRYGLLVLRVINKEIANLVLQPEFLLLQEFKRGKRKFRNIIYRADFQYTEGGKVVVEDVKGIKTPSYQLKKKLLLQRYREIVFREVTFKNKVWNEVDL